MANSVNYTSSTMKLSSSSSFLVIDVVIIITSITIVLIIRILLLLLLMILMILITRSRIEQQWLCGTIVHRRASLSPFIKVSSPPIWRFRNLKKSF